MRECKMSYVRICPGCGAKISNDPENKQNFCPVCGKNLWDLSGATDNQRITMISAYKKMLKNYAQFNGRSRRSEYWYVVLANFIIMMIMYIFFIPAMVGITQTGQPSTGASIISFIGMAIMAIYCIAMFVPGLALFVRRLHDTGKSGWFILLGLIPYIGGIVLFVFSVLDSQPGENQYGPNPKGIN